MGGGGKRTEKGLVGVYTDLAGRGKWQKVVAKKDSVQNDI